MLLRADGDAVVVIGQPAHAWVSGQIARSWGNERFGSVESREVVCLAAEQHDVGMAGWDLEPTLNTATGRPHGFTELPLETHLALWTEGPRTVMTQSPHAALLVSMHGTGLYERRDLSKAEAGDAAAIRSFLADQRSFQGRLAEALRADPASPSAVEPARVARHSRLIWAWDALSLALLLDWAPYRTEDVPTAGHPVPLDLVPVDRAAGRFSLDPWPFAVATVTVWCPGRRLEGRFSDELAMRRAVDEAPWRTLAFELVPAAESP